LRISACRSLGTDSFYDGDFRRAQAFFEEGAVLSAGGDSNTHLFDQGQGVGLHCINWLSWTLWMLGFPDEALKRSRQALRLAGDHPYSHCQALHWSAVLQICRSEPEQVSGSSRDAQNAER
jgi:hypothetical protein